MKKILKFIWKLTSSISCDAKLDHTSSLNQLVGKTEDDVKFTVYVRSWGNNEQLVIDQEAYVKLSKKDQDSYFQEDWIKLGQHWTRVV